MTSPHTLRIRELNDQFRQTGFGGKVLMTQGISALPFPLLVQVSEAVRTFRDFTRDNDPHGEHDFGAFTVRGERIFWKIDYYAPDMMHGSENPADPAKTVRVLTIMLAGEY